jgi:hypothetical protein
VVRAHRQDLVKRCVSGLPWHPGGVPPRSTAVSPAGPRLARRVPIVPRSKAHPVIRRGFSAPATRGRHWGPNRTRLPPTRRDSVGAGPESPGSDEDDSPGSAPTCASERVNDDHSNHWSRQGRERPGGESRRRRRARCAGRTRLFSRGPLARSASVSEAIADADTVVFAVWLDTLTSLGRRVRPGPGGRLKDVARIEMPGDDLHQGGGFKGRCSTPIRHAPPSPRRR